MVGVGGWGLCCNYSRFNPHTSHWRVARGVCGRLMGCRTMCRPVNLVSPVTRSGEWSDSPPSQARAWTESQWFEPSRVQYQALSGNLALGLIVVR